MVVPALVRRPRSFGGRDTPPRGAAPLVPRRRPMSPRPAPPEHVPQRRQAGRLVLAVTLVVALSACTPQLLLDDLGLGHDGGGEAAPEPPTQPLGTFSITCYALG